MRISEIREREQKATSGPWFQTANGKFGVKIWSGEAYGTPLFESVSPLAHSCVTKDDPVPQWQKDCDFVRCGRMDIPFLLEMISEAEHLIKRTWNSISKPPELEAQINDWLRKINS